MCVAKSDVRFTPDSDRESEFSQKGMSALPPKADMCSANTDVRFGPKADIACTNDRVAVKFVKSNFGATLARPCACLRQIWGDCPADREHSPQSMQLKHPAATLSNVLAPSGPPRFDQPEQGWRHKYDGLTSSHRAVARTYGQSRSPQRTDRRGNARQRGHC